MATNYNTRAVPNQYDSKTTKFDPNSELIQKMNFDADWYAKNNPDIHAGVDPLTHYLVWGKDQGRSPNADTAARQVAPGDVPVGDPTSAGYWGGLRQTGANATAGINRMPWTFSDTAALSTDPSAVFHQFFPQTAIEDAASYYAKLKEQEAATNLGMGTYTYELSNPVMGGGGWGGP